MTCDGLERSHVGFCLELACRSRALKVQVCPFPCCSSGKNSRGTFPQEDRPFQAFLLNGSVKASSCAWSTAMPNKLKWWSLEQFSSVIQSCLTLCDPMSHSTPGIRVHHQLLESIQNHVHWVSDAIQPSHPLSPPSPPALNLSQHQGLFQWVSSSHQVAQVLEFQLQHQSFQWTPRTDLLWDGLVGSPCSPRDSQESSSMFGAEKVLLQGHARSRVAQALKSLKFPEAKHF